MTGDDDPTTGGRILGGFGGSPDMDMSGITRKAQIRKVTALTVGDLKFLLADDAADGCLWAKDRRSATGRSTGPDQRKSRSCDFIAGGP
jgi:hypothetical protein